MNLIDLFEAIPFNMARKYTSKQKDLSEFDEIFNRFAKYKSPVKDKDPKLYRLYFPMKYREDFDSLHTKTRKEIMYLLNTYSGYSEIFQGFKFPEIDMDFNIDLYKKGYVNSVSGRTYKIGKLLNKAEEYFLTLSKLPDEELKERTKDLDVDGIGSLRSLIEDLLTEVRENRRNFENDPIRIANKEQKYWIVISRHPYDIATMSTNRGWTSCTNLITGDQTEYIETYIRDSLVAYLIKEGDWNLQNPTARVILQKFINEENENDWILHPLFLHGTSTYSFRKFITKFVKIVNRGKDAGVYCSPSDAQYDAMMVKRK